MTKPFDSVDSIFVIFFRHSSLKFHQQLNSFSIKSSIGAKNQYCSSIWLDDKQKLRYNIWFLKVVNSVIERERGERNYEGKNDRLRREKTRATTYPICMDISARYWHVTSMTLTRHFVYFCLFLFEFVKIKKSNIVNVIRLEYR